ncbi:hypothetical protein, partial [Agrobacterium vitis]|uniref:hypothetical protein n=1 Tax=Agrobacterium vitis TaxID=373 RepID=UPI001AEEC1F5
VHNLKAAHLFTVSDNVHGYNTGYIDVDIASALPYSSPVQDGLPRMRTIERLVLGELLKQDHRREQAPNHLIERHILTVIDRRDNEFLVGINGRWSSPALWPRP